MISLIKKIRQSKYNIVFQILLCIYLNSNLVRQYFFHHQ